MAVIFSDGFDPYAQIPAGTMTDMLSTGLYSSVVFAIAGGAVTTQTPFGVGQSLAFNNGNSTIVAPFANQTTIYGSIRVYINTGTFYANLTFSDAGTAQCTIRFNCDGSLGLYSGGPTGTLIQTYTSQFALATWNSFQFKIVIDNVAGSIEIRQNGATSNTITKTGINTRFGTTNAYVNSFTWFYTTSASAQYCYIDDLFLNSTSGNAPTSWPGDLRAIQQYPTAATQSQFSVVGNSTQVVGVSPTYGVITSTNGVAYYHSFTASFTGTLASIAISLNAGVTGHVKLSIFDASGSSGGPGVVITNGNATTITNPVTGINLISFATPPNIVLGTTYWIGKDQDASMVYLSGSANTGIVSTTSYASFPASNPNTGGTTVGNFSGMYHFLTYSPDNSCGVYQLIEDGDTSYIYTQTVAEDKYPLSPIATTYSVVAVDYYAMWKRSDAGPRTCQLSVAANGSSDTALVTSSTVPTSYAYSKKTCELDPTGAAWTPTTVNGAILGIAVTA